jgi:hypothetical protein
MLNKDGTVLEPEVVSREENDLEGWLRSVCSIS